MSSELQLIEERIVQLEQDVRLLKTDAANGSEQPWWVRINGQFKNDKVYDEVVRLGKEFRESQRPEEEN